jgi:hypothetical protein
LPTNTYTALATTTVSVAASSITFSSIPATYRDLVLIASIPSLSGSPTARGGFITLNGTGLSSVFMTGNGSTASSGTDGTDGIAPFSNAPGVYTFQIMDYSATDKHKTVLTRGSIASIAVWAIASRYASTSAVTSVTLTGPDSGTDLFGIGSTFSLYGVIA